jgi:hypothetical protein
LRNLFFVTIYADGGPNKIKGLSALVDADGHRVLLDTSAHPDYRAAKRARPEVLICPMSGKLSCRTITGIMSRGVGSVGSSFVLGEGIHSGPLAN